MSNVINNSVICVSNDPKTNAQSLPDALLTLTATYFPVSIYSSMSFSFGWAEYYHPIRDTYAFTRDKKAPFLFTWLNHSANLYWALKLVLELLDEYKYRFDREHPSERVRVGVTLTLVRLENDFSKKELRSKTALPLKGIPSMFWLKHDGLRFGKRLSIEEMNLVNTEQTNRALVKNYSNTTFTKRSKPDWLEVDPTVTRYSYQPRWRA